MTYESVGGYGNLPQLTYPRLSILLGKRGGDFVEFAFIVLLLDI